MKHLMVFGDIVESMPYLFRQVRCCYYIMTCLIRQQIRVSSSTDLSKVRDESCIGLYPILMPIAAKF